MVINPARYMARSRDARRISDVKSLANSISYALSGGNIRLQDTVGGCLSCTSVSGTRDTDGTNGWVKFSIISGDLSDFVAALPEDPLNNSSYYYEFASDGKKFELNARLEDPLHYVKTTSEGGTDLSKFEVGSSLTLIP